MHQVTRDAVIEKDLGLYYLAHVVLENDTMAIDGKHISLERGMAVSAETKLGGRRIIEFMLSPLLKYRHESARER